SLAGLSGALCDIEMRLAPLLRCHPAPALEGAGEGRLVGVTQVQRQTGDGLRGKPQLLARLVVANVVEQAAKAVILALQRQLQAARMLAEQAGDHLQSGLAGGKDRLQDIARALDVVR